MGMYDVRVGTFGLSFEGVQVAAGAVRSYHHIRSFHKLYMVIWATPHSSNCVCVCVCVLCKCLGVYVTSLVSGLLYRLPSTASARPLLLSSSPSSQSFVDEIVVHVDYYASHQNHMLMQPLMCVLTSCIRNISTPRIDYSFGFNFQICYCGRAHYRISHTTRIQYKNEAYSRGARLRACVGTARSSAPVSMC